MGGETDLRKGRKEPAFPEQRDGALDRRWGPPFLARMDKPTELGLKPQLKMGCGWSLVPKIPETPWERESGTSAVWDTRE